MLFFLLCDTECDKMSNKRENAQEKNIKVKEKAPGFSNKTKDFYLVRPTGFEPAAFRVGVIKKSE